MKKLKTKDITIIGILSSLSIVLGLTPLGMLPIGVIRITTLHIPTIIGALVGGPIVGGIIGIIFGLFSLVQNIIAPVALSFIFINPLVSILPRFLIGFICGYLFNIIKFKNFNKFISFAIIGAIGSIINTSGILVMAYIFYKNTIFQIFHIKASVFLSTIALTNGPGEIIASAFITAILGIALISTNIIKINNKKRVKSI